MQIGGPPNRLTNRQRELQAANGRHAQLDRLRQIGCLPARRTQFGFQSLPRFLLHRAAVMRRADSELRNHALIQPPNRDAGHALMIVRRSLIFPPNANRAANLTLSPALKVHGSKSPGQSANYRLVNRVRTPSNASNPIPTNPIDCGSGTTVDTE